MYHSKDPIMGNIDTLYEGDVTTEHLPIHTATMNPDTLYLHEARKEKYWPFFKQAMIDEMKAHFVNRSYTICKREDVKNKGNIFPAVWSMKRKRRVTNGEIYKWKACLNLDGSKQIKYVQYDLSYSPVVTWEALRAVIILSIHNKWAAIQVDYVQTFPQAPVERDLYMEFPKGISMKGYDRKTHVLKIHKNIYGQEQAGKVWHDYLINKQKQIDFTQCEWEECLLIRNSTLYILYIDDSIIIDPNEEDILKCIEEIRNTGLKLTNEGPVKEFLGI